MTDTTANASPRPWRVRMEIRDTYERRGTFAHVEDANGETICTTITPRCDADAALIVDAVNERDSLRDELYNTRLELAHAVHSDEQAGKACRKWAEEYRALREERDRLAVDEARYRAHNVVLRDIVRRLLPSLRRDIAQCNGPKQAPRLAALLDEARAAIGEGVANG